MTEKAVPIEDYYGTLIDVEDIMASPGPMVDLTIRDDGLHEFVRLSPEAACDLADRLRKAARCP